MGELSEAKNRRGARMEHSPVAVPMHAQGSLSRKNCVTGKRATTRRAIHTLGMTLFAPVLAQPIAHAADGLDERAYGAEFAAQRFDVHINGPLQDDSPGADGG